MEDLVIIGFYILAVGGVAALIVWLLGKMGGGKHG